MGVAERRQREKEELRGAIVDAAVEIVSTQGVEALSIRGVAERIEYAPATIYLYFENKDALLRTVVEEAARRFDTALAEAAPDLPSLTPVERLRGLRRAYIRFALEQTAAFRLLFALPKVPFLDAGCRPSELSGHNGGPPADCGWTLLREAVGAALQDGSMRFASVDAGALALWASVHGYVTLYLAGRLDEYVSSAEELIGLVENS